MGGCTRVYGEHISLYHERYVEPVMMVVFCRQFPMAKFWPGPAPNTRVQKDEVGHMRAVEQSIRMPPVEVQDHLIKVFFTYVNPSVPVLDEESFMSQYNS